MAVSRSVETRAMEGIRRDFLADADAAGYFTGGVKLGPLFEHPTTLRPPQIAISLSPDVYETGTGGVTRDAIAIIVKVYFPIINGASDFEVGEINPVDWIIHLQKIIGRGGADNNEAGKIVDPDAPADPTPVQKYVNTGWSGCTPLASFTLPNNAAQCFPFMVNLETRTDNITRERR